jgi:hypothetical protein
MFGILLHAADVIIVAQDVTGAPHVGAERFVKSKTELRRSGLRFWIQVWCWLRAVRTDAVQAWGARGAGGLKPFLRTWKPLRGWGVWVKGRGVRAEALSEGVAGRCAG